MSRTTSQSLYLCEGGVAKKEADIILKLISEAPLSGSSTALAYSFLVEQAIGQLRYPNTYLKELGHTLLTELIANGQLYYAGKLIERGADINLAFNDGRSTLHFAAEKGNVEALKFCLAYGLSVHSTDVHKLTPIQYAIANGKAEAVEFLLMNHVVLYTKDSSIFADFYADKVSKLSDAEVNGIVHKVQKAFGLPTSGAELMADPDRMEVPDDFEASAKEEALARHIVDGVPMEDSSVSRVVDVAPSSMEFFPARTFVNSSDYYDGMCIDAAEIVRAQLDKIFETSSMAPLVMPASTKASEACGFKGLVTGRNRATTEVSSRTTSPVGAFGFGASEEEDLSVQSVSPSDHSVSPTGVAMDQSE